MALPAMNLSASDATVTYSTIIVYLYGPPATAGPAMVSHVNLPGVMQTMPPGTPLYHTSHNCSL